MPGASRTGLTGAHDGAPGRLPATVQRSVADLVTFLETGGETVPDTQEDGQQDEEGRQGDHGSSRRTNEKCFTRSPKYSPTRPANIQ